MAKSLNRRRHSPHAPHVLLSTERRQGIVTGEICRAGAMANFPPTRSDNTLAGGAIVVSGLEVRPVSLAMGLLLARINSPFAAQGQVEFTEQNALETVYVFTHPTDEVLPLLHKGRAVFGAAVSAFAAEILSAHFDELRKAMLTQLDRSKTMRSPREKKISLSLESIDLLHGIGVDLKSPAPLNDLQSLQLYFVACHAPEECRAAIARGALEFECRVFAFADTITLADMELIAAKCRGLKR